MLVCLSFVPQCAGIREGALARGDDANATDAGGTSRKDGDIDGTVRVVITLS